MEQLMDVFSALRVPAVPTERWIQDEMEVLLIRSGIEYRREAAVAPGSRVDFLIDHIAVEVKKGKPSAKRLRSQVERYARSPLVAGVLLVVERSAILPGLLGGKPCRTLMLNRLWGVALP